MNYRHAFHAGNFADIFKHIILTLLLQHLRIKPAAFRIIDTHAGAGLYDLSSDEARRTGESADGIGRFDAARMNDAAEEIVAPFRAILNAFRDAHGAHAYPGSPEIARRLLRDNDRLVLNELHGPTHAALRRALGQDARVRFLTLDAAVALRASVPPPEKRGLVLIDPAFEQPDEFEIVADSVTAAWRKWPAGIYAIWYPVKQAGLVEGFMQAIARSGIEKVLRTELHVDAIHAPGLNANGMLVINAPWTLPQQLETVLPELARLLGRGRAGWRCEWLVPERGNSAQN
ncbi:MAG: 23S rRNA (adenine(2030)-N(6))-methyltransferase RlmJ [Beijerinckiaceae bacterium]